MKHCKVHDGLSERQNGALDELRRNLEWRYTVMWLHQHVAARFETNGEG